MALERVDVRSKLDHDDKEGLRILYEAAGQTEAKYIEEILVPIIRKRLHDASVISARATLAGITGNNRESSGKAEK